MRKIVLYIAASIDGYIARKDGNVDWLEDPDYLVEGGDDMGYGDFYAGIDITLMGNATYQEVLGFDVPFPYPDKKNYVFSRSEKDNDENVEYVSGDIVAFTKQLKNQPGKDIWLIGGGKINTIFLENELIDQIILTIVPFTLGDGIPMFHKANVETKFKLESNQTFPNGMVQLTFNKK